MVMTPNFWRRWEGSGGEAGREEGGRRAALVEPLIWDLQGSGQMLSCLGEGGEEGLSYIVIIISKPQTALNQSCLLEAHPF